MRTLNLEGLPHGALLLLDSAPVIFAFKDDPIHKLRFMPMFDAHAQGRLRFAVSAVTVTEVLTGAFLDGDEALARRYRALLESWRVVPVDVDLAEHAARIRVAYRLKLPDAVQVAAALAICADALVTHDRDFGRVKGLRILS